MIKECCVCGKQGHTSSFDNKIYCPKHKIQIKRYGEILSRTRFDKNEFTIYDNYAEILLYDRHQNIIAKTKIDLEDVEKCRSLKWFLKISGKEKKYVQRRIGRLHLSHYLLGFEKESGIEVDHANGDTLDNRKNNLRVVTHQENMMNQRVLPSNNTSGHIGVSWDKKLNKWIAQIKVNQKHIHLGVFYTIEEAIGSRKQGELKYFGKNKLINFENTGDNIENKN